MKIVCEACQAKYSIADEKVRGKVFKIRCKKCSHVIVVRGSARWRPPGASGEFAASPSSSPDLALDAGWHIVVEGEQVGPLSEADVRAPPLARRDHPRHLHLARGPRRLGEDLHAAPSSARATARPPAHSPGGRVGEAFAGGRPRWPAQPARDVVRTPGGRRTAARSVSLRRGLGPDAAICCGTGHGAGATALRRSLGGATSCGGGGGGGAG